MTFHSLAQLPWTLVISAMALVTTVIGVLYTWSSVKQARSAAEVARISVEREYYEKTVRELTEQMARSQDRWADLNHLLLDSVRAQASLPPERLVSAHELGPWPFLEGLGLTPSDLEQKPEQVFVLTPFSKNTEKEYLEIAEACRQIGLVPRRGDEVRISGSILPYIVRGIASSRLIIANINGRNPNVFYELGIAQAIGKPVIIVAKDNGRVPFDLRQQQLVLYRDLDALAPQLKDALLRLFASEGARSSA